MVREGTFKNTDSLIPSGPLSVWKKFLLRILRVMSNFYPGWRHTLFQAQKSASRARCT